MADTSTNDCKRVSLKSQTGLDGHNNDMELAWLKINGATSNNLNDAWVEMLIAQGITRRHIQDMMLEWLLSLGAPFANLTDNWNWFWCVQGGTLSLAPQKGWTGLEDCFVSPVTQYVHDEFNDVAGTLLINHTPDIDVVGGGWSGTTSHDILTADPTLFNSVGGGNVASVIDIGQTDMRVEAEFTSANSASLGICCRITDVSNFWMVRYDSGPGRSELFERQGGSFTARGSVVEAVTPPVKFQIKCVGDDIQGSCLQTGSTIDYTSVLFNTITNAGIRTDATNRRMEYFTVDNDV